MLLGSVWIVTTLHPHGTCTLAACNCGDFAIAGNEPTFDLKLCILSFSQWTLAPTGKHSDLLWRWFVFLFFVFFIPDDSQVEFSNEW